MALAKEKHIKFWRLNANLLPNHYQSNDSSRMTLGFFIVAALDLLDGLKNLDQHEISAWIEWIYACQCSEGGFRGFSGTNLNETRNDTNRTWDPPNVPATFFALLSLLILGDDMVRVKRRECLEWLPKMQRDDGSFGEVLGETNAIEGGRDLRFCCCAAGIAYVLQGSFDGNDTTINVDSLVAYINDCQNYNGGFGEAPGTEPHSGLTYCAIAALEFVKRLGGRSLDHIAEIMSTLEPAIRWMLERQTNVLEEPDDEDNDEDDDDDDDGIESAQDNPTNTVGSIGEAQDKYHNFKRDPIAGFNGREGKIADTCYCFWNTGALAILHSEHLIDNEAMRRYLLEKTQHMIGGFGKGLGAPPDVMHSYLGLAALSLFNESGIKPIDPCFCISIQAVERLNTISWKIQES